MGREGRKVSRGARKARSGRQGAGMSRPRAPAKRAVLTLPQQEGGMVRVRGTPKRDVHSWVREGK